VKICVYVCNLLVDLTCGMAMQKVGGWVGAIKGWNVLRMITTRSKNLRMITTRSKNLWSTKMASGTASWVVGV